MPTQVPQTATVTLTDAQIKTLPTTGVTVVAAPGAGKIIVPLSGLVVLDTTGGAYATSDVLDVSLQLLLGTREVSGLIETGAALEDTEQVMFDIPKVWGVGSGASAGYLVTSRKGPLADYINQPLVVKDDYNGVPNYTGGHASNSLVVTVVYLVLDV